MASQLALQRLECLSTKHVKCRGHSTVLFTGQEIAKGSFTGMG